MSLFGFLRKKNACLLLADPEDRAARKYRHFRDMLAENNAVLDGLAALEQTFYGGEPFTTGAVRGACRAIVESTRCMADSLNDLSQRRHEGLYPALDAVLAGALAALEPSTDAQEGPAAAPLVVPLSAAGGTGDTAAQDALLGGKGSKLALVRSVAALPTPDGFVLTTAAFRLFLRASGLEELAAKELEPVSPLDLPDLEARSLRLRQAVRDAPFPPEISSELAAALKALTAARGPGLTLAVRSSAVGEDGAASFAGQYESVLNVAPQDLEAACRMVFASKYSPHAILYRLRHGLEDADAPMAVLVLAMVHSKVSGVLYTVDPSFPASPASPSGGVMRLDAVEGLGEKLVSGEARPSAYALSREPLKVLSRPEAALLTDAQALELARMGLALEAFFGSPQDVEWCLDQDGSLVVVQSRPLGAQEQDETPAQIQDQAGADWAAGLKVILQGGTAASSGAASGEVVRVEGAVPESIPEGAILAARNAAPELAALLDRAGGVVTAMGGAASHLASVAREMGIPALFGLPGCPEAFSPGQVVTLDATGGRVLEGRAELPPSSRPRSRLVDSPMHRRLRAALDLLAPLTLTDPDSADFKPENCRTLHDVVRYAHEMGMREMFGLCDSAGDDDLPVARLKAQIPLILYCVDLGGGLRENLTTCDDITPDDLRSVPMLAVWRGFTHPGITWSGTIAFDAKSFMTLMASSATAEVGGGAPGGDSYAMLGRDYLNLSARFGYHFANVDAFCGGQPSQNHVTLRFAGGAGGFTGKCLRVAFLSRVLARLGFTVDASGDVLDGSLKGAPQQQTEDALDQLGRLLACSRLLDMAITGQAEVESMAEAFLRGDYDLLAKRRENPLPEFHLALGDWECLPDGAGRCVARQDGSEWATGLSKGLASLMGRLSGGRYQRFLDTVEAYFHFPLAVAKGSEMGDGRAALMVRPVAGVIDQAAGLAFAVRSAGTYLVLRVNALEDNLMLFAFKDGRRTELASARLPVETGRWRELAVEVRGGAVTGFVDGKPYIVHHFDQPPVGLVGLWSKADSVAEFAELTRSGEGMEKRYLAAVPQEGAAPAETAGPSEQKAT
ncbi:PEP/pyruvate-binding domain-containing protein [Fundidesulfovibrio soli]|uniref:PEP/pyruvate-binding domain-containing protein n=1 Tax=Fundidesulfovibrio soli TaxID=2922716 RepID=UPI001FAFFEC8|nr:PEP/pyruvate-binding domain-containing protein [Fundidesulfovibrio soli]